MAAGADDLEPRLEPDLIQARVQPLMSFENAMRLPYSQECLRPLFGPGMSQQAWDSGKFNVELHCIDPWMKKNWRRFRYMCTDGGKDCGERFNLLRRTFMRMLWLEREGILIDWKTVDVSSSRLVSEHRGTNEGINSKPIGSTNAQREAESNKKRQRCLSPAPMVHHVPPLMTQMTSKVSPPLPLVQGIPKRQGNGAQAISRMLIAEKDENRMVSIVGIQVLQEAGLVIVKQEELAQLRGNGFRAREEIARLRAELETEKCLQLATESGRRNDFARMYTEGSQNREAIHRLKTEVELLRSNAIIAAEAGSELRMDQGLEFQQGGEGSCSICQKDLKAFPTVSTGFCKCQFHIHCFWMRIASTEKCNCGSLYPGLLYTYLGRLPQIGARPAAPNSLANQTTEKDAAGDAVNDIDPVELQKAKIAVRELLRECI